jgi:hypothetical protein
MGMHGFDNCDLHPDQYFGCFFGQKEVLFFGEKMFFWLKV